ncbi:ankyrin repeat-containing domain protein [Trichoderma austrokoningii]
MTMDNSERHGERVEDYPVQARATADFFTAIARGQEGLVKDFIENDANITNMTNERGETPLIAAVRADKPTIVRDLLWNGAKVDGLANYSQPGQDDARRTPLHVAVAEGKLQMICILRENCADVFFKAPDGVDALQLATINGDELVLEHIRKAYDEREIHSVGGQRPATHLPPQLAQTHDEEGSSCNTWAISKFILDKTPKTIISAITKIFVDKPKEVYLCCQNVELWCQEQIQEFPTRVSKGKDLADYGIKESTRAVTKTTWQLMKRARNAIWTIILFFGWVLRKLGKAASYLFNQLIAIVQSIAKLVAAIFQAATLRGVKSLQKIFTKVARSLSRLVTQLKQAGCAMLQNATGSLGKVIIIFAALALGICILLSKWSWGVLQKPRSLAKKGVQEILGLMGL